MRETPRHSHSRVELKISCTELPNLDILSKSDPQVILLAKNKKTKQWEPTPHRTEVVMNNLNPKFIQSFVVDYIFEELQQFRFIVVDVDDLNNPDWRVQDFIGQCDCDLGSIVGSPGRKIKRRLYDEKHPEKHRGHIIISAEEVNDARGVVTLQLQAHNVGTKGFFKQCPNLFFVISRANEDNTYSPVYESMGISSVSPLWSEFKVGESTLCNGDKDRSLLFQVKHYKKNGDHPVHGQCTLTLRELISGNQTFPINSAPNSSVKIGKGASLCVLQANIKEQPTFLDYISGGTEINLVVAIDFTESNGRPHSPMSLHYIDGREQNDYQRAISSVGKILEGYDSDKLFPVYGFGGKFDGKLSHAHPLNNNHHNPEVEGVDGILNSYLETMSTVELYGPTNFSPIINQAAAKIKSELASDAYYILLIITDGVITDMDSTVRAIIKASSLPLSIVIVGVGDADFTNMKILDADDVPLVEKLSLYSEPTQMERDIVQFVAMRDFESRSSHYLLPKAVLEEIPNQLMSYMELHGKTPRPPIRRNTSDLKNSENRRNDNGKTLNKGVENLEFDEPPPKYSV